MKYLPCSQVQTRMNKKKQKEPQKGRLHQRNLHQGRYDLNMLIQKVPQLANHIKQNINGEETINFANTEAILYLNKALLLHYYDLKDWFIPADYLCPPVPGRADYIHHVSDLIGGCNFGKIPKARVLDIGTGANGIYPIIGTQAYDWQFVGSEIDDQSIENLHNIIAKNDRLKDSFEVRKQGNSHEIISGVIHEKEQFDLVMCNPPFYASAQEAEEANLKKTRNLGEMNDAHKPNFGGQNNELWCPGGEKRFISQMINESKSFATQCFWFTSLVSKASHLKAFQNSLDYHKAHEVKVINMSQGNKASRILAWTFLDKERQKEWKKTRWDLKSKDK